MLDSGDAPALLFTALQHRQLLPRAQGVDVQRVNAIPGGVERVEHRVDILLISHTIKLAAPTDRNRVKIAIDTHSRNSFGAGVLLERVRCRGTNGYPQIS